MSETSDYWIDIYDFLGTGNRPHATNFRSFIEAREFARSLGLKSQKEWFDFTKSGKKPNDVPSNPRIVYSKERLMRKKRV
jgi:hypothetical protein